MLGHVGDLLQLQLQELMPRASHGNMFTYVFLCSWTEGRILMSDNG